MKSNSWKKNYVVTMFYDYDNSWRIRTKPLTLLQAIRFVQAKGWMPAIDAGTVRIDTME